MLNKFMILNKKCGQHSVKLIASSSLLKKRVNLNIVAWQYNVLEDSYCNSLKPTLKQVHALL